MRVYRVDTIYGKLEQCIASNYVTEGNIARYKTEMTSSLHATGRNKAIAFRIYDAKMKVKEDGWFQIMAFTKGGRLAVKTRVQLEVKRNGKK